MVSSTSRDTRSPRQVTLKALPIEKANIHNVTKNASTDFLTTALSPSDPPCLFRVQVALPSAGKLKAIITKATVANTVEFNGGANLAAASLYIFDMLVHTGDTVNFQSDQAQAGIVMRVQEIAWGTQ